MIKQRIYIKRADWDVCIYYAVDTYYTREIMHQLMDMGADEHTLRNAYDNLSADMLDTGLTYSNFRHRQSLMVIALTSSPEQFANSLAHEQGHLMRHISQALNLDVYGEEEQYILGEINQKMFPVARRFLCDHCRQELSSFRRVFNIR